MGDFIGHPVEKNALTIKKLHDSDNEYFATAKQERQVFPAINLFNTLTYVKYFEA
jgi:hypothetical protein